MMGTGEFCSSFHYPSGGGGVRQARSQAQTSSTDLVYVMSSVVVRVQLAMYGGPVTHSLGGQMSGPKHSRSMSRFVVWVPVRETPPGTVPWIEHGQVSPVRNVPVINQSTARTRTPGGRLLASYVVTLSRTIRNSFVLTLLFQT